MRDLLDVNVLIALLDADHLFHQRALTWFGTDQKDGWASCPLTQNAFFRISASPRYSRFEQFSISDSIEQLSSFVQRTDHEFWADDVSVLDASIFDSTRILGPRQITDIYLTGLAAKNNGRLVTFDERIPISAISIAGPENICVL